MPPETEEVVEEEAVEPVEPVEEEPVEEEPVDPRQAAAQALISVLKRNNPGGLPYTAFVTGKK